MGLSAGAIYVSEPNIGDDLVVSLGLVKSGSSPVKHTEAGFDMSEGLRVGVTDKPWTVVLGGSDVFLPHMEQLLGALPQLSQGRRLLFWYTQSASGGVIFEIHENGELRRKWVEAEGQVFEDVGLPLPEEQGLVDRENHEGGPLHSEWTVLELVERMTAITPDEHFEMDGPVYAAAS